MSSAKWRPLRLGLSVSYHISMINCIIGSSEFVRIIADILLNTISPKYCKPRSIRQKILSITMSDCKVYVLHSPSLAHMIAFYVSHDSVIKWKHFPRYCLSVRVIHRSAVTSRHKGQWRVSLKFFFHLRTEQTVERDARDFYVLHIESMVLLSGRGCLELTP